MKKTKIITMIIIALSISFITACQSESKKYAAMGLTFIQFKDDTKHFQSIRDTVDKNAYICRVDGTKVQEQTLEIPAKFKNKPVLAVKSNGSNDSVTSITFSEGIQYIENGFRNFDKLTTITFPSTLTNISYSFGSCDSLTEIAFNETIRRIYSSFDDCSNLSKVILSPQTSYDSSFSEETKVLVGSKEIIDYSEQYFDREALIKQAWTHIGQAYDESKKVININRMNYRSGLEAFKGDVNGPIVTMDRCPDCNLQSTSYNKKALPKSLTLSTIDVYTFENDYPETLYTESKIQEITNKEPIIYCFVEMMGYKTGPKYFIGGTNVGSYLNYRLSIWNHTTDELIAWTTYSTGYAPSRYSTGDQITFPVDFGENSFKRFFLEEDGNQPDPLYMVGKYVFGQDPEKDS